ncbi:MAG: hypothetical protein MUC63_10415 [Planctomycetes bacterium]|jgi:hypothetical protein|nr:hypothetical protein [Planctomycetota bacterium]
MARFVPLILGLAALLASPAAGAEKDAAPKEAEDGDGSTVVSLLPRILIEAELGAMGRTRPGHTFRTQRRAHIRLGELEGWFADSVFEEELLWGDAVDQVDHTFDYFRAGRRFGPVAAFLFWNHTCNNPVWGRGVNKIHWNDLGVEVTNGPDPGDDRRLPLHLRARIGAAFMLNHCEYRWVSQASARWQPMAATAEGPYAELILDVIGDPDRTTVCPIAEVGATIRLGNGLSAEPFVRLERRRDSLGYGTDTDTWFLAGLRVLQLVGPDPGERGARGSKGGWRLDLKGGYAGSIPQTELGYASSVGIRLVAPGFLADRAFLEVHAGINTPPDDMFPNFEVLTAGPSLEGRAGPLAVRGSYRYRERWGVAQYWRDVPYRACHAFRIDLSPDGWLEEGVGVPLAPPRLRWELSAAIFPAAVEFPYQAEAGGSVRAYLFPAGICRFFLSAETRHFLAMDGRTLLGLASELSMAVPGLAGDFRLFLRFERAADPFRYGKKHLCFLGFDMDF